MNLHVAKVRRGSSVYTYGQLVESYRRSDGMPTQKVVANLGRLTEVQIENFRAALEASRSGQRVFLDQRQLPVAAHFVKPTHNLRYLDVAVLRELWLEWGLHSIFEELLSKTAAEVAPGDVIAALTFQRCVDPGSKLHAERWFPTTSLPELLGIDSASFNNTRLHRVLDQLEQVTPALMQRLPRQYTTRQGEFAALFLDVTDARFVGHGPALAEKAKTKEGLIERKIGIVLLCNERGYPLRWHVIAGKRPDAAAMHEIFEEIRGLDWVGEAPVVCDRAMGCSAEVAKLLGTGVRFVTALRSNEWRAYTNAIPHQQVADLEPSSDESTTARYVDEAANRVVQAGMHRVSPTLYVQDLGVIERDAADQPSSALPTQSAITRAMLLARQIRTMVDQATVDSFASAARRLGVTIGMGKIYRQLLALETDLQEDIIEGRADGVSLRQLQVVAAIRDAEAQRCAFNRLRTDARVRLVKPTSLVAPALEAGDDPIDPDGRATVPADPPRLRVRAVVSFNPRLFVDHRRNAQRQLDDVRIYVRELNESLARRRSSRTPRDIEADLDRMLRRRNLLEVFKIRVDERPAPEAPRYQVHVELDVAQWQRRRRHDGFGLILAHPAVPHSAAALCELYRAKDAVEKDFQIIKGLVRLRPMWHRTDSKVRAHVTLCMLALLLERTLNERLKHLSAEQAIETLSTCRLNRFQGTTGTSHYVVTHPDQAQAAILRELRLQQLADDNYVTERLHHRG